MSFGISAFSESPFASESGVGIQVSVTGVSTATTVGSVTITAIQNPTVAVTGIELTGALGQAQTDPDVIPTGLTLASTVASPSIIIDVSVDATGQDLTITQGEESVVVDVDVDASGQNLTSATGSVSIAISQFIDVTGQELTGALETPSITGDANVDVTGSAMTITQGEEFAFTDVTVEVTGQSVGTVAVASVSIDLNTPVDLTGNQLNTVLNNPFIQSWNAVDPDVANTWTDVDLDVANNWTDVDIAA